MILKDTILREVSGDITNTVTESKINASKFSKLFGILSGMYADIKGAIIQEYVSNAWDAHKAKGNMEDPILITFDLEDDMTETYSLTITDMGIGMSDETMNKVYFNYLETTKEDSNEFIGAFGLGCKCALAYTESFEITTTQDGVKNHYIFFKNGFGIPSHTRVYSEITDEGSGTSIKIPVKGADYMSFKSLLETKLYFFPNVVLESNFYTPSVKLPVFMGKNFMFSPDYVKRPYQYKNHSSPGCVVVGNVAYPRFPGDNIHMEIAVKLAIGDVTLTPSRESIEDSTENREIINTRIKEAYAEILGLKNATIQDASTFTELVEMYRTISFSQLEFKDVVGNVTYLLSMRDVSNGVKRPTLIGGDSRIKFEELAGRYRELLRPVPRVINSETLRVKNADSCLGINSCLSNVERTYLVDSEDCVEEIPLIKRKYLCRNAYNDIMFITPCHYDYFLKGEVGGIMSIAQKARVFKPYIDYIKAAYEVKHLDEVMVPEKFEKAVIEEEIEDKEARAAKSRELRKARKFVAYKVVNWNGSRNNYTTLRLSADELVRENRGRRVIYICEDEKSQGLLDAYQISYSIPSSWRNKYDFIFLAAPSKLFQKDIEGLDHVMSIQEFYNSRFVPLKGWAKNYYYSQIEFHSVSYNFRNIIGTQYDAFDALKPKEPNLRHPDSNYIINAMIRAEYKMEDFYDLKAYDEAFAQISKVIDNLWSVASVLGVGSFNYQSSKGIYLIAKLLIRLGIRIDNKLYTFYNEERFK